MTYSIEIGWKWWEDDGSPIDLIAIYKDGELLDGYLVPCVYSPPLCAVDNEFWEHHRSNLYDIAGRLLCEK